MLRKIIGSLFLLLFIGSAAATAQPKIGYMNTQEVLSQVPERNQIQKKLSSFIEQKRAELRQRTTEFQDSVAEFQQNQSAMSQQEIARTEKRLAQMEQSLQSFQQNIQQQIQRRRSELLQPIYERMNDAIAAVAKKRGLDLVLNEATGNGENIIYYAESEKRDITDEVLQQMIESSESN